jgi:O-antigen ligase
VSKTVFLNNKVLDKSNIALVCIFGMFTGFLISPAVLSISMMVYGASALRDVSPRHWIENKWWLVGVAWISIYALTYFWSVDKDIWGIALQVKLPFLLLPLAFAYTPGFSSRQLELLTIFMGLLLFCGACYSLSFLIRDPQTYIYEYNFSHLLPTPCRQDHISFSLSITLYIIWAVYVWPFFRTRWMKLVTTILIVFLGLYIHILAAKSGIVSLYIFLTLWSVYLVFTKRRVAGIIMVIAIPLFLILAVSFLPTFSIRKDYISYSLFMLKFGDKSGNYGDINRIMASDIAMQLIKKHPISGIGTGDVMSEMKKAYHENYPVVKDEDVLMPHNQFLIVALGCGIPAMLIFTAWVLMPLVWLRKNRQSFFFLMVWLILLLQLLIDTALEAQMGVFIFVFFILLQKQELEEKRVVPPAVQRY